MTSAGLALIILLLEMWKPLGWHLLVLNILMTQIHLLILRRTWSCILSSCRTVNAHLALMSYLLDVMTLQSWTHLLLLMKLEVSERLLCILTRILMILVHVVEPRSKMRTLQHSIRAVKWLLICCIYRKNSLNNFTAEMIFVLTMYIWIIYDDLLLGWFPLLSTLILYLVENFHLFLRLFITVLSCIATSRVSIQTHYLLAVILDQIVWAEYTRDCPIGILYLIVLIHLRVILVSLGMLTVELVVITANYEVVGVVKLVDLRIR